MIEDKRGRMLRALGTDDDAFFRALLELAEGVIEEQRAQAGNPLAEPHVAKGYACMSAGVDAFVAELEAAREAGRKIRAGATTEEAES